MRKDPIRIGTRESQLAVWQADLVKQLLEEKGHEAELVLIKSEGDIDLVTPLYAMGVQGVFTRSLDTALLNQRIDIAVHSMKDVPVQLPEGIRQAAVLKRANHRDILVLRDGTIPDPHQFIESRAAAGNPMSPLTIATSSIRRRAQWLNRYPQSSIENLRGNVNTRLKKLAESQWDGAIFAAAGLERIGLRPLHGIDLEWMLPAPAQGAIMIVARQSDAAVGTACASLNDQDTAIAVQVERAFLSTLMGGCSTPISAFARVDGETLLFQGNIVSADGATQLTIERDFPLSDAGQAGMVAAEWILDHGGREIVNAFKDGQ